MKAAFLSALVVLITALSGCSHGIQIREHAMDYNRAISGAENEMLLLNILRASRGEPMKFTRIDSVTGSLHSSIGSNIGTSFGAAAQTVSTQATSIGAGSRPTYVYQPLNTKQFYNDFTAPIGADTFRLYMEQGWDVRLLAHALIEEARLYLPSQPQNACKIIGNPDDKRYYEPEKIQSLADFVNKSRSFDVSPLGETIIASNKIKEISTFLDLNGKLTDDFVIQREGGDNFRLVRSGQGFAVLVTSRGLGKSIKKQALARLEGPIGFCDANLLSASVEDAELDAPYVAEVILRSPSGLFHALGEMVKLSEKDPKRAAELRFLRLKTGGSAPSGAISTVYKGQVYWIPEDETGDDARRLLWLAQELFSLNVSSDDDPVTNTFQLR